jgi:hypothetical protein
VLRYVDHRSARSHPGMVSPAGTPIDPFNGQARSASTQILPD